jgi:hypothetical protein
MNRLQWIACTLGVLQGSQYACGGPTPQQQQRDGEALARLIYTDIDIAIEGQTIEQVIRLIAESSGVSIHLLPMTDRRPAGIDPNLTITLNAFNRPALNLLQDALAQCGDTSPCTWQVRHGAVEVSTKEVLGTESMKVVRVLPIEDQIQQIPNYDNPPNLNLGGGGGGAGGGGGGAGGGGGGGAFQFEDLETRRDRLIEVLTHNIEPTAWERNGGTWASMQPFQRSLIIRAPRWIHRQLTGFDFRVPRPSGRSTRTLRFEGDQIRVEVPLSERLRREAATHS